jgi:hypothetical protein
LSLHRDGVVLVFLKNPPEAAPWGPIKSPSGLAPEGRKSLDESGPPRRAANGYGYDGYYDHGGVGERGGFDRRAEKIHLRNEKSLGRGTMSRPSSVGMLRSRDAGVRHVLKGGDEVRTASGSGGTQV